MNILPPIALLLVLASVLLLLPDYRVSTLDAEEKWIYHWHARLTIIINGQEIPIPAGIGLPGKRMHTHEWDNIIHMEAESPGFTLGEFFDNWGVVLTHTCLFQYCNEDYHFFVNNIENTEYENYRPQDGDDMLLVLVSS